MMPWIKTLIATAPASSLAVGVLAFAASFLGAMVALVGTFVVRLTTRETTYIQTITSERLKWVNNIRDNIADLTTVLRRISDLTRDNDSYEKSKERQVDVDAANRLVSLLFLKLNPHSPIDRNIMSLVSDMPALAESKDNGYASAENLLFGHAQWLLKEEWEKVKREARVLKFPLPLYKLEQMGRQKSYQRFSERNPVSGRSNIRLRDIQEFYAPAQPRERGIRFRSPITFESESDVQPALSSDRGLEG